MKEEELIKLREELNETKEKQKDIQWLLKEKKDLEDNPFVKRYVELKNMDIDNIGTQMLASQSEEQLINNILTFKRFNNTNKIYVYMGTYTGKYCNDIIHSNSCIAVNRNDEDADYSLYVDLEKKLSDIQQINIKDREKFEENNNIIYPKGVIFFSKFKKEFFKLKEEFIKDMIENGQEKAVSKVLKRTKK